MDTEWLRLGWKQFIRRFRWLFISLSRQKVYNTWCSQSFSHTSTNQALRCLTSVTGEEPVHSTWFGRRHWHLKQIGFVFGNTRSYNIASNFLQYSFISFFKCILMVIFPDWRLVDSRSDFWAADHVRSLQSKETHKWGWITYLFIKFITTNWIKAFLQVLDSRFFISVSKVQITARTL